MRHAITAQAISDQAPRFVFQPVQQTLEEALGRRGTPAVLHEDVEHDPVLVHCPPEIVQHAVDPDEHLIEVPGVSGLGSPPPEPSGEVRTKFPAPVPNTLVRHDHAALSQDQFDISQAHVSAG